MKLSRRNLLAAASVAAPALLARAGAAASKPLVIDAHCHAGHGQDMTQPWNTIADPKVTLDRMAEAGIDRTIIFPINNDDFEKPNREVAQIVQQYPGKFIGFAKHDPVKERGRIPDLLRREVRELGLKGLKLHDPPTRDILDTVAELKIPVLYHPGRVSQFHLIAANYPQINFIMAHLGVFASRNWTEHIAAIDMAKRYPNVYLETSSVVFFRFLEMAVKELGPERVIFGTDGPELDSRVEIHKIRLLKLKPEDEAAVLGGNIAKLLPPGTL